LNDHSARYRLDDRARHDGFLRGWLAGAVRAALSPDPRTAALGALLPLGGGPLGDPVRRAGILATLRSGV
jgi:hypothetical protein